MKLLIAAGVGAGLVYLGARLMAKLYAEVEFEWPGEPWDEWDESQWGEFWGDDENDLEVS